MEIGQVDHGCMESQGNNLSTATLCSLPIRAFIFCDTYLLSLILVPCATLNVVHFLLNKWRCLFSLALLTQILNGEDGLLANGSWERLQTLKDQTNTKMDGWMDDHGTLSTPIMHITELGDLKVK
jgi:hypothetical protein